MSLVNDSLTRSLVLVTGDNLEISQLNTGINIHVLYSVYLQTTCQHCHNEHISGTNH